MNRTLDWKPKFPKTNDRKVSMSDDQLQAFAISREVGLIVTGDVKKKSPACFWVDEQSVYLRMNWGTWYKVSKDSPEILSAICKRHTAKLTHIAGNRSVDCFIPVFHLDRLPPEIFEGVRCEDWEDEKKREPDEASGASVRSRLAAAGMIDRLGEVVGEYKKGDGEFVLIRGARSLMLVSFFTHREVEWLADETCFNDAPPLWFSETAHLQSPLYSVALAAEYLKTEFDIGAIPVAILDDAVTVINLSDMRDSWRKTGVRICYCRREEDGIPAFDPGDFADRDEAPDDQTVAAAAEALDVYEPMSTEDWEKLLQQDDDEEDSALFDPESGRRYCLGKYHSEDPCCDFQLVYDFHQLRLLPDESSDIRPTAEMLAAIGKRISKAGAYSDFGLSGFEFTDHPDEVRTNVEAADRLFTRSGDWLERRAYDSAHDERLKYLLVQIERFWRRGNPVALRDVGLSKTPLWSLVFETEPAALLFQYPDEEKWREHAQGLFDEYIEEYAFAVHDHQDLTIFCVVILDSIPSEELRELNKTSPPGMFFVSPETLNENVMRIFMEEIFGGSGKTDCP